MSAGPVPSGGSWGESKSLPFPASRILPHSLARGALITSTSAFIITLFLTPLPPSYPYDDTGPTQIIQDNLPIPQILNLITPAKSVLSRGATHSQVPGSGCLWGAIVPPATPTQRCGTSSHTALSTPRSTQMPLQRDICSSCTTSFPEHPCLQPTGRAPAGDTVDQVPPWEAHCPEVQPHAQDARSAPPCLNPRPLFAARASLKETQG